MAVAPGIHIVEDFEKAFQDCVAALTNQDLHNARDSDEIRTSVDLTVQRFLDISKQMDCFFLQKRLLLSVQKPEHLLVENIQELSAEVKRKDELIEKYTAKIQTWQNLLNQDVPGTPRPQPPPIQQHQPPQVPHPSMQGPTPVQQQGPHPHHMMHPQQHPSPMQQGMVQMQGGMHPPPGGMQGPPGGLQGPLAYLERTMSSIGNVCNNMPNF
ncbi:hypothetical protein JTE90_029387 [Oedothorax gibbosus]|uniref:Mediator of RNA polymerase II transcription subunit 28 n=1 Tax=Oedothorax gibbosus TaxID=931172 RepID=A0AAV6VPK8_9ARAC|nr:hypothetical protein JTE90_029387 [Oedothorax gibbosus]